MPTIYEGGRHYVINVYPTLDMLKDIQTYPGQSRSRATIPLARTPCTAYVCTEGGGGGWRTSRAG
ncbi:hypothetical protein [Nitrososphaera sp.]|uniref:hypothetical protein n=1 Tax=Nitrososphaera sp. TaxID=1971748 RepID=UPI00307F8A51